MKIIFLKNNLETGFIKIQPNDSLTAKCFIDCMNQTTKTTTTFNTSITRNKLDIINDFNRMREIIKLINATDYDEKITTNIDNEFTLETLFDLHEWFERSGARFRDNDPTLDFNAFDYMNKFGYELNGLIHKLEGNLHGQQWFQALFTEPSMIRYPLNSELINEAVISYKPDYLYVGYGETGKNMSHIYEMNDHEVLNRRMIQPQRYILSEIMMFFESNNTEQRLEFDYIAYEKWCINNKVREKGYDFENPIWYGKWEIGKVVDKSFDDFSSFPYYDTIIIEDI